MLIATLTLLAFSNKNPKIQSYGNMPYLLQLSFS